MDPSAYSNGNSMQKPAYPAMQPLAHTQAGQQSQQSQQQLYPSVQALASQLQSTQQQATVAYASAGDTCAQQYQSYAGQQQQQASSAYPSAVPQQNGSYPVLSDAMHKLSLNSVPGSTETPAAGTIGVAAAGAGQQYQQTPLMPPKHYPSLPPMRHEQQQQQPDLSAQSFPAYMPHSQQQQGSGYPTLAPHLYPQQQQQQQAGQGYPMPNAGAYLHSSSGTSQQFDSFGAASFNSGGSSIGPFGASSINSSHAQQYGSVGSASVNSSHAQQQQQQQEALPPYPAVPQALPTMPFNTAPDKVPAGYDVMLYIQNAKNLPACDWWNGLADPYVVITAHIGGQELIYKTAHKRSTVNPEYDNEFFQMGNLPSGTTFFVEVWDKDMVTDDDVIGRATWSFCPKEMLPASTAGGGLLNEDQSWGRLLVKLPLKHPSKANKAAGQIELEVCFRPSTHVDKPRMLGPVRFRQHLSPAAGVFTGHWWSNADTMSFSTYKLFLTNISSVFGDVRMPWNKKYDKAVAIFKNPVVLSGIRTQHSALYSTHLGNSRGGVCSSAADFFELFRNGVRSGERRFFTYVLCEDSFRCSETGAAFFNDMFSKHAMHSGGAEEVLFAGEFCIVPCPEAAGGHKLVIDNNSGTYAPDKSKLGLMQKLFVNNFRDMEVEVLDMKDPKLKDYQLACPSRSGLSGAAAAAAVAAAGSAGSSSAGNRESQA